MKKAKGTVKRALISVFDKTGLKELGMALAEAGVEILASGGTAKALDEAGVDVTPVEAFTGAKEVLGGRVKTLHPKIHAGILADRRDESHLTELASHDYLPIDLVVCNLYPFREVLARGGTRAELIENIDVGGPTMIRAAAKNADGGVTVITEPVDYAAVSEQLRKDGTVSEGTRRQLAVKAFQLTSTYDTAIASWGAEQLQENHDVENLPFPERLEGFVCKEELRYGENPHQRGFLYLNQGEQYGVARGELLAGKPLSYNNFIDMDGAYRTVWGLSTPGCAIIKHTNPCGLAEGSSQAEAFLRALEGDPVSAFGSVIGFNTPLEVATVEAIKDKKLFVECVAAPDFLPDALEALKKRTNLRLLRVPAGDPAPHWHAHRIGGGLLVEQTDPGLDDLTTWKCVADKELEEGWLDELAFAMRAVAALKSNAIAITKDRSLLGAGTGQMSRVDATEHAIKKASDKCSGGFLGSDAFFPFDDCVRLAAEAGVKAIVQPGGSKRDADSIAACNELGLAMVFTGRRHFRH
ncbi:bifunctional phosphoribosylaminoimidazolecarboxamide formyltransferase/IMP cyclohydrolase [Myxococcota bacterium]